MFNSILSETIPTFKSHLNCGLQTFQILATLKCYVVKADQFRIRAFLKTHNLDRCTKLSKLFGKALIRFKSWEFIWRRKEVNKAQKLV